MTDFYFNSRVFLYKCCPFGTMLSLSTCNFSKPYINPKFLSSFVSEAKISPFLPLLSTKAPLCSSFILHLSTAIRCRQITSSNLQAFHLSWGNKVPFLQLKCFWSTLQPLQCSVIFVCHLGISYACGWWPPPKWPNKRSYICLLFTVFLWRPPLAGKEVVTFSWRVIYSHVAF